jgi:hypothetical protein
MTHARPCRTKGAIHHDRCHPSSRFRIFEDRFAITRGSRRLTDTKAILSDIYDAWREQNLDLLASYLPFEFCHAINFPPELHPAGGIYESKQAALARWRQIFSEFTCERFDTLGLLSDSGRAAVEVSVVCRHRQTDVLFQSTKAHFWTIESGWPVKLNEYYDLGKVQSFVSAVGSSPALKARG